MAQPLSSATVTAVNQVNHEEVDADNLLHTHMLSQELKSAMEKVESLIEHNNELRENIQFLMKRLDIREISWEKSQPTKSENQSGLSDELAEVNGKIGELTQENKELSNITEQFTTRWRAKCAAEDDIKKIVITREIAKLEYRVNSQPIRTSGCGGGGLN